MKAVILAGGLGSRLSEETVSKPKPMVEIGNRPILWHIMKIYSAYGITDFVICLGYKGHVIKEFFSNYSLLTSDVTFDLRKNAMEIHQASAEPWRVTLVETGAETMTGGRLKRVRDYLGDEDFCFTYGDGVADIDIDALIRHHREHGRMASVTAVRQPSRFGHLHIEEDCVTGFLEKPEAGSGWVNGGFFVLSPGCVDYIDDDATVWEQQPLERLAGERQLVPYYHRGFWHSMDTLRDRHNLEAMWAQGDAPWKTWS